MIACALSLPAKKIAVAQAEPVSDIEQAKRIEKYIFPILKDRRFIDLDWSAPMLRRADHGALYLPPEKPEHTNGVYRIQGMSVTLYKVNPLEMDCLMGPGSEEYRVITNPQNAVTYEQAKERATGFMRDHFGWVFELQPHFDEEKTINREAPVYSFSWHSDDAEGFPDLRASANVRSIDGKIISSRCFA